MSIWRMLPIALLVCLFIGCKERVVDTTKTVKVSPAKVPVSPRVSPGPAPATGTDNDNDADDGLVDDFDDDFEDEDDDFDDDTLEPMEGGAAVAAGGAARPVGDGGVADDDDLEVTPEDAAEIEAQNALSATHRAVNRALDGERKRLMACASKGGSQEATVRIRVHSTGRVVDASVSGVKRATAQCIERVLDQMQVAGVQTDSITVERTFQFH